jgi:thiol-disulfide isomerase/thioredoxin
VKYNAGRAKLIRKIIEAAPTETDRTQWWKQLIDGVAASVQSGMHPDGLKDLQRMESQFRRDNPKSELLPYVTFRRLLGEYTIKLQTAAAAERADVQKWWLKELEDFATTYPKSEDASEAMLQLAITLEFSGQSKDARKWYGQSVAAGEKTPAGIRAAGALRRLDLVGKPLSLSGPSLGATGGPAASATQKLDVADYRGKVVLVIFWSTWCKPCTEDLPQLQALYRKHKGDGFEILGVNLDADASPTKPFIARHRVPWPHIHRDGGLDSPPARQYGIISLPTMFLVDRSGKVLSRSTSVEILQKTLPGVLKGN